MKIDSGNLEFNDFSLPEKFTIELAKINISADSIDRKNDRVNLKLNSQILSYGNIDLGISVNPVDSSDFDMNYRIKEVPLFPFNPYLIAYTSFPFDRGTLEVKGNWHVRKGNIKSLNHIIIVDPRVCRRIKNDDSHWLPIPLILALAKERGNVIDYEIPINGDLKNPKFNFKDVISDLFENIFIKPPSIPYIVLVKNTERVIEKTLSIKWPMRSSYLSRRQKQFIKKIRDFLVENPEAKIEIHPQLYHAKEKENILLFEAKKMFLLSNNTISSHSFSEKDSLKVVQLSVKDSLFVQYVNKMSGDKSLFTLQEKCSRFINNNTINSELNKLQKARKDLFVSFFKEKKVENRLVFLKSKNTVPYNGFSFYEIKYQSEFPEELIQAYDKMSDLNKDHIREKYFRSRLKAILK